MWTKNANSCVGCTHVEAVRYCEGLELQWLDWHIPSISGLRSLRDDSGVPVGDASVLAIVESPFTEVQQCFYWTYEFTDKYAPTHVYIVAILDGVEGASWGYLQRSMVDWTSNATWCFRYLTEEEINGQ